MNLDKHSKQTRIIAIIVIMLLIYLIIHQLTKSKAPAIPLPVVVVQKPIAREMVDYVTQTGTTVALNSVNLVARVEGYLDAIEFTDGTMVKKGQELFVIQPESYLEQLKAAQATVAANKAVVAYDKSEYARQQKMYRDNATSLNNVEKWLAKTHESDAELAKAVANEEIAKINYGYTHITAPFSGRMGRHLVDANNLVGNGVATTLATISQVDTLYVYFNMNEIDLIKLRNAVLARKIDPNDINKVIVDVKTQNETDFKYKATLNFVNTGLNASTGTMELRALLDNKDNIFVPGLFVQVRIPISKAAQQLTVPAAAVLYDQIGPYLYVVDKDNVVLLKRVTVGSMEQGNQAITKGLDAQDRVVIDGIQNATPGNKVELREQQSEKGSK